MLDSTMKEQDLGRAKNFIQEFLVHKLLFPKVYLDADWNGKKVDVLAIDRTGNGDVHAVYIVYQGSDVEAALETVIANIGLHNMPHFLYVAVVNDGTRTPRYQPPDPILKRSLAPDGIGRVGILYVDLSEDDARFQVRVLLKAERRRSSKEIFEIADQFMAAHTPNWEYREE
jgi:hypothetical protein